MATVMKASEFVKKLKDVAQNYKTLYVMGCFGAPMTEANKKRYINHHSYNRQTDRTAMINAASSDTFGFDCVCLIKGILWGWYGDKTRPYGGAGYAINGVPDIGADSMFSKCSNISSDFSKIEVGEAVWRKGHIGVYIGDGLAVECTPIWANKVQITSCNCTKNGYNTQNWTKHGKLPYIQYDVTTASENKSQPTTIASSSLKFAVNNIVQFNGDKHYPSADAKSGYSVKASRAKITNIYKTGKHPYHLRAVDTNGKFISGVYGWVDANTVSAVTANNTATTAVKVDYAQKMDKSLAGSYKVTVTDGLHIRTGAGTSKKSLKILKFGETVNNYGYYSIDGNGEKWLYVACGSIVGFCSSRYLKKC